MEVAPAKGKVGMGQTLINILANGARASSSFLGNPSPKMCYWKKCGICVKFTERSDIHVPEELGLIK